MTRIGRLCATAVAAVAISGCATGTTAANGPAPRSDAAKVQVHNNNWADMTVLLERAGRRVRLGTVTSMSSRVMPIPTTFLAGTGGVRVVLDPLGGSEAYRSEMVDLWPGQVLDLRIENHLGISTISVWNELNRR